MRHCRDPKRTDHSPGSILSREPCVTTSSTDLRGAAVIELMTLHGARLLLPRSNAALPNSGVARNKQGRPSLVNAMSVPGPRQRQRRRQHDYSGSGPLIYVILSREMAPLGLAL